MKASELIKRLQELVDKHGDLDISESVLDDETMSDVEYDEQFGMFFIV